MASFPSIPPSQGSYFEPRESRAIDYDGENKARVRDLGGDGGGTFKLKFELNAAERGTLMTFYGANPLSAIDFTWVEDGVTYQVQFAKRPVIKPGEGEFRDVDVDLVIVT